MLSRQDLEQENGAEISDNTTITPIDSKSQYSSITSTQGGGGIDRTSRYTSEATDSLQFSQTVPEQEDDVSDIIARSFSPRVGIIASTDTEELIRVKGIYGGIRGLMRPFGECVKGKVVIRDSAGASKSWKNFGVHFVDFDGATDPAFVHSTVKSTGYSVEPYDLAIGLDNILRHHINLDSSNVDQDYRSTIDKLSDDTLPSSYYLEYLRKLLTGRPLVPHETFTHPVACVIAISSQNPNPIETLRDLYNKTRSENQNLAPWVSGDFLRYYLLVHDEDQDDISKSTLLFNQMKRHFGLHCHLLRLRSEQCSQLSPKASKIQDCRWLDVHEELAKIEEEASTSSEDSDYKQYIFDTDVEAIQTFVREMVTQSVIPFMEGRIASWNDQVASRRRGLGGRFVSFSKKWAGFGSSRSTKASSFASVNSGSNYDPDTNAYRADSSEATMHRLADYAVMLRDWKLSRSVYDMLRTDFAEDKAWNHHAIVNEMSALSQLFAAQFSGSRMKIETINSMIDSATYSYITRCSDPFGAIRCLVLSIELFLSYAGSGVSQAIRWAERLLELSLLSPMAQCLMVERLVHCFKYTHFHTTEDQPRKHRKQAMWNYLSSQQWLSVGYVDLSTTRLHESRRCYSTNARGKSLVVPDTISQTLDDEEHSIAR